MSSKAIGIACLLGFAIAQGVRDAFFGNAFQSVSMFIVAALAFGTSSACFGAAALARGTQDLSRLVASRAAFATLNVTTCAGWLSFFYALRHLEPAVAATLYNGVGPLTILALQAFSLVPARKRPSPGETICYVGVGASLTAMGAIVLMDGSGLALTNRLLGASALAASIAGGAMIAISHMIARRYNDAGVGSDALMGTRFLLTLVAAVALELALGNAAMRPEAAAWPILALTAFALIMIPSFMLQLGIARASPLAVNVMRSLGPVFVFLAQQLDDRLHFSGPTLICIVAFCALATASSVLRAWHEAAEPSDGGGPHAFDRSHGAGATAGTKLARP